MSSPVEQIKDKLNIVDVISAYVKLEKAGVNFKGRCPFHNEKTGSFFVSPSRQTYHCFGCNKGGDMFSFIEDIDGVEFKDALKILADRAGVKLEAKFKDNGVKDETDVLFKVLAEAVSFYINQLSKNKLALDYLYNRGLTKETISDFSLGFAPNDWRQLHEHLNSVGYDIKIQKLAGLVIETVGKNGRPVIYDRFRSRIMFPIFNQHGKPVGFSGRIFGNETEVQKDVAKYINSPQTPLYDKSSVLYAYHTAKEFIRKNGTAVLVEGQMDVLLLHQIGIKNAIAVSGTALTGGHLVILKRLADHVIMAFDADEAGIKAMRRALEIAFEADMPVKVVPLPTGLDPADLAKDAPDQLIGLMNKPVDVVVYFLNVLAKKYTDKKELSKIVSEEIYPLLARINRLTDKAHYVKNIADTTNLSEDIIWQDLNKFIYDGPQANQDYKKINKNETSVISRQDKILAHLVGLLWLSGLDDNLADHDVYKKLLTFIDANFLNEAVEKIISHKEKILLEVELIYSEVKNRENNIKGLAHDFSQEYLRNELLLATRSLKEAEMSQDFTMMDKYLKKCQDVSQLLNQLNF